MPRENPNAGVLVLFGTHIAVKNGEHMGYLGNYEDLGQAAAEIQVRLPPQLHARCGGAGRAARHWPSDSPFRLRLNYAVPSGLYGRPASARRAIARRGRKLSALLAALLFAASGAAQAKSITALTPSFFDVNKAIDSAVDGDTVIIPAGTASWTSQLVITKAITLMGKTTTDSVAGTAQDNTIIQANLPAGSKSSLIRLSTSSGKTYRLSGFTFRDIGTVSTGRPLTTLEGTSASVRIDHCHYDMGTVVHYLVCIQPTGSVYGVADHNVIVTPSGTQPFHLDNGGDGQGFTVWAAPTNWGGSNFFFIEDNYILMKPGAHGLIDSTIGGRSVVRHNHCHNVVLSAVHGTEGSSIRSNRATEIYNNDAQAYKADSGGSARGGTVLFYNNTWCTGTGCATIKPNFSLDVYRELAVFGNKSVWRGADGTSPWDVNDNGSGSPAAFGQAGHQYWSTSGTATCGTQTPSSGQLLSSGTPSWTSNQWTGFGVTRTSDGKCSLITGNSSNTLFLVGNSGLTGNSETLWTIGDQYAIHRVLVAIDQSGRGQGDLLTKNSNGQAVNTCTNTTGVSGNCTANTATWPRQLLDPCYSWNNRQGATHIDFTSSFSGGNATFKANRDYYNEASAVGGVQTTGVGIGTLANRPASGVGGTDITGVTKDPPGTAYWATDVASKNGSTDKGALYVWRGGAWVLYYQPYTYPHPLTRDLAPPSNLRIAP